MNIKHYINPDIIGVTLMVISFVSAMAVVIGDIKGRLKTALIAVTAFSGIVAVNIMCDNVWSDEYYTYENRPSVGTLMELNGNLYSIVISGDGSNIELNRLYVQHDYTDKYKEVYRVITPDTLDIFLLYDTTKEEIKRAESPDCSTATPIRTKK